MSRRLCFALIWGPLRLLLLLSNNFQHVFQYFPPVTHLLKCPSFHPVLGPFLFRGFHILPHTSFWERTLCSYASKVLGTTKVCNLGHAICLTLSLSRRRFCRRETADGVWRQRQAEAGQNCYTRWSVDLCQDADKRTLGTAGVHFGTNLYSCHRYAK